MHLNASGAVAAQHALQFAPVDGYCPVDASDHTPYGEIAARKLIGLKNHFLQRHSVEQITDTIVRIHLSIPVI